MSPKKGKNVNLRRFLPDLQAVIGWSDVGRAINRERRLMTQVKSTEKNAQIVNLAANLTDVL
jgi:hypothetical protein